MIDDLQIITIIRRVRRVYFVYTDMCKRVDSIHPTKPRSMDDARHASERERQPKAPRCPPPVPATDGIQRARMVIVTRNFNTVKQLGVLAVKMCRLRSGSIRCSTSSAD